jgi:hypothetical protein
MTWLDTMTTKAKQLAGIASKKTGEAVEISKLKVQASQINSMMRSTYERIGTLIYDQEKTGVDNYDIVMVCISEIDAQLSKLSDINARIAAIKSGSVCPSCGAPNPSGSAYCAVCGGSMDRRGATGSDYFASPMGSFTAEEPEDIEAPTQELTDQTAELDPAEMGITVTGLVVESFPEETADLAAGLEDGEL